MSKNNKNILSEALEEAKIYSNILSENAQEILENTLLSETNALLEVEDEDEDEELDMNIDTEAGEDTNMEDDADMEDETSTDVDMDIDIDADADADADEFEIDDEDGDEIDVDDIDLSSEEGDTDLDLDADLEGGLDSTEGEDDDVLTLDMTASSDEDVIKVFKKMNDDDEIEVVGDKVIINDPDSDNEYQIEMPGADADLSAGADLDAIMEEEDEEVSEDVLFEFDETEEDVEEEEIIKENENLIKEYTGIEYETIVFLQGHEAREALAILDERGGDAVIEYLSQWDNGDGGEIATDADFGSDSKMYHNDMYTVVYNRSLEYIGLYKDLPVVDDSDTLDEQIPVGMAQAKRVPATNAIEAEIIPPGFDKLNEEIAKLKEANAKLVKENAELVKNGKAIAKAFKQQTNEIAKVKDSIVESSVYTQNLAGIVRIFLEESTTKSEKTEIIKRLNEAKTIAESKSIEQQILSELRSTSKASTNLFENTNLSTSTSKTVMKESYQDPNLAKIKGMMYGE